MPCTSLMSWWPRGLGGLVVLWSWWPHGLGGLVVLALVPP